MFIYWQDFVSKSTFHGGSPRTVVKNWLFMTVLAELPRKMFQKPSMTVLGKTIVKNVSKKPFILVVSFLHYYWSLKSWSVAFSLKLREYFLNFEGFILAFSFQFLFVQFFFCFRQVFFLLAAVLCFVLTLFYLLVCCPFVEAWRLLFEFWRFYAYS